MCFSATASFMAFGVLGGVGVYTVSQAKEKRALPLAIVPILFALQQLSEGGVWLNLTGGGSDDARQVLSYIFLLFSDAVWPFFIPFCLFLIEPEKIRRRCLFVFSILGAFCSVYLFSVFNGGEIVSYMEGGHIVYKIFADHFIPYAQYFYFTVTCVVFLFTSYRWLMGFGFTIFVSYVLTHYFAGVAYISVWCFCAAVMSSLLCFHFRAVNKAVNS